MRLLCVDTSSGLGGVLGEMTTCKCNVLAVRLEVCRCAVVVHVSVIVAAMSRLHRLCSRLVFVREFIPTFCLP